MARGRGAARVLRWRGRRPGAPGSGRHRRARPSRRRSNLRDRAAQGGEPRRPVARVPATVPTMRRRPLRAGEASDPGVASHPPRRRRTLAILARARAPTGRATLSKNGRQARNRRECQATTSEPSGVPWRPRSNPCRSTRICASIRAERTRPMIRPSPFHNTPWTPPQQPQPIPQPPPVPWTPPQPCGPCK